jgi:hypothetical protein
MNQTIIISIILLSLTAIGQIKVRSIQFNESRIQNPQNQLTLKGLTIPSLESTGSINGIVISDSLKKLKTPSMAQHLVSGGQDGNGGNMVICLNPNGTLKSKELLDFYESRVLRGITPSLGDGSMHYIDKIELVFKRIQHLSPRRFKSYLAEARSFESQSVFLPATDLMTVPDSRHPSVPKGCAVIQTVIQKTPVFPQDKRYVINKDIWDLLDHNDKAGLVLHEVILREAVAVARMWEQELNDSTKVRYINSMISSEKLADKTPQYFADLAKKAGLVDAIELFGGLFYNRGKTDNSTRTIYYGTEIIRLPVGGYPYEDSEQFVTQTTVGPFICKGVHIHMDTGVLLSCNYHLSRNWDIPYQFPLNGGNFNYEHHGIVYFYPTSKLKSACIAKGAWVILNPDGSKANINLQQDLPVFQCGRVTWDERGFFVAYKIVEFDFNWPEYGP